MLSTAELRERYWDTEHENWTATSWRGTPPAAVIHDLQVQELTDRVGLTICEVGIGSGALCRLLAGRHKMLAIDVPSASPKVQGVATFCASQDIESLSDHSVDLVLSYLCFQHIAPLDLDYLLGHLCRLVVPGGRLAFQYAVASGAKLVDWFASDVAGGMTFLHDRDRLDNVLLKHECVDISGRTRPVVDGVNWVFTTATKRR